MPKFLASRTLFFLLLSFLIVLRFLLNGRPLPLFETGSIILLFSKLLFDITGKGALFKYADFSEEIVKILFTREDTPIFNSFAKAIA